VRRGGGVLRAVVPRDMSSAWDVSMFCWRIEWLWSLPISEGVAVSIGLLGIGDFSVSGLGIWRAKLGVGRSGGELVGATFEFALLL
jgi:hypothetical protein